MPRPSSAGTAGSSPSGGTRLLVIVPLVLAAWVYHGITRIYFFADDWAHLASIRSDGLLTFLMSPFGGHNYLVRNLVFLASWSAFGLNANLYYGSVLLTHLVNAWLLFDVLAALTGSAAIACFGATVWSVLPMQIGALGWYSVFGEVLLATILLVVLRRLMRLAAAGAPLPSRTALCWYVLLLAGTTCFAIGVGVALAFPVVLFLLLPDAWRRPRLRLAYLLLPAVTLGVYFGLRRLSALIVPLPFEEAMQEYMALNGLKVMPPLLVHLLTFSAARSVLVFFFPRYPSPVAWAAVTAFVGGVVLLLWRGDWRTRRAAVAMGVLCVAIYFLIAVGRANAYAMFHIEPERAATVARYHYVGTIPMVALLCLVLQQIGRLPGLRAVPAAVSLAAGLGLVVGGYWSTGLWIQDYNGARGYFEETSQEIVTKINAAAPGTTVYIQNTRSPAYVLGPAVPNRLFPGPAGVFVLLYPTDQVDGRTVRFVESDPEVQSYYRARPHTRIAKLLVFPDEIPASP